MDINYAAYLKNVKSVAVVGASNNPARPSYQVGRFLLAKGMDVIGINPGLAGQTLYGQIVMPHVSDLTTPIDMIDIFRNSEAAGETVDDILKMTFLPKIIWMQIGVIHENAAQKARAAGIMVVMDKCPKIEWRDEIKKGAEAPF